MLKRDYYSTRKGRVAVDTKISFELLKRLFRTIYEKYDEEGYWQKHFGYDCVDADEVPGELGADIGATVFLYLRKADLWPLRTRIDFYNEDDLFTMIEFMHDHVSKPIDGHMHSFSSCEMHFNSFNDDEG